jgi:hypothetical protein
MPEEVEFMKGIPYLAAVGALMYLATSTCPDIAYTVGCLARFNSNPGIVHWHAVKHLLRYLKGTADYSITYAPDPSSSELFSTISDADHGGCKDTGRSTGGYLVKIGSGAVSWCSKGNNELEYIAAVSAGKEIRWMRNLLVEIGFPATAPSIHRIDNQSAMAG